MSLIFGAVESGWQVLGTADGGGGDSITVNAVAVVDADFDDATPAAPAGGLNVKWQKDALSPANVSAYMPYQMSVTADGSGLRLDGDAASPGATMLYGTNASSVKGWYAQPGGGSGVTAVVKSADQSFSVTALADVTDMQIALAANASGMFHFNGSFWSAAATTGLVLGLTTPATTSFRNYRVSIGTSNVAVFQSGATADNTRIVGTAALTAGLLPWYVDAAVINGSATGNVTLRAASEVNASAVTLSRGAYGWKV